MTRSESHSSWFQYTCPHAAGGLAITLTDRLINPTVCKQAHNARCFLPLISARSSYKYPNSCHGTRNVCISVVGMYIYSTTT